MVPLHTLVLASFLAAPLLAQDPPKAAAAPARAEQDAQDAAAPKVLKLGEHLASEVSLLDIDGKAQDLHALKGKIAVINFYSIQCPIQAGWDNRLAKIQKDFEGQGVAFLHIDSNQTEIGSAPPPSDAKDKPYENVRSHLAQKKLPFRVLVDHGNKVADLFEANTTPHVYVFDKEGVLVYRGLVDDDQRDQHADGRHDYLRDVLGKLTKGDKVEPFSTKEVGCSIKRASAEGREGGRGRGRERGERRRDGQSGAERGGE